MSEHEHTVMAFDDQGREVMIDILVSVKELGELARSGPVSGEPALRTREGHPVSYLGGGEFSVTLPGEEATLFRTDDLDVL
ncbi:hypothetical protein [Halomonas sp.]|uniref:hypothetical protein n=1 Tax=Halomonas sp. TaxID=1486246 RepID=UPI003D0EC8F8